MSRPGLKPRKEDPYFIAINYLKANPVILVFLALILTLIFTTVLIWMTVEAAHMAGVASYG